MHVVAGITIVKEKTNQSELIGFIRINSDKFR